MKKIFTILVTALALTSCGSVNASEQPPTTTTTQVTTTTTAATTSAITTTTEAPATAVVENPSFRNTKWGMSVEEVKAHEDLALIGEDSDEVQTALQYASTSVAGLQGIPYYGFQNDKLYRAFYKFDVKHSNDNLYIDDFNSLVKSLTQKYGEPKSNIKKWFNDLYKDDPDDWGMAVAAGHLAYVAQWDTEDTAILLYLKGDNFKMSFALTYTDINYDDSVKNTTGL